MLQKKTEGTTTKDEKSKQVPPSNDNVSYNAGEPTDRSPRWFISEMEKGIQWLKTMIEGCLTKLSGMMKKIVRDNGAIGCHTKCTEEKQREFQDSLAAMQHEFDDYKKAEQT